ncbi:superoxide dismutase [Oscillospiraceae bacterium MB08-C2-2]|nr:superoxide dismutase [Oscillospiraceae bacterium MB08-C2-2]
MFEQIKLNYSFNALEPYIDTLTMETHYLKHLAAYTKNFNEAAKAAGLEDKSAEWILANWETAVPQEYKTAIRNNGGGFLNHNLYFQHLSPKGGGEPSGALAAKIKETFGSYENFKDLITKAAMGQFGSGWAWLSANAAGDLKLSTSPNQDNPILETGGVWTPILGIDVWEHAYYLKHLNLRGDYLKDLFHVLDWKQVEKNYADKMNSGK